MLKPFEGLNVVAGAAEAKLVANLTDRKLGILQESLGPLHLLPGQENRKALASDLIEKTAEVAGTDVAKGSHLLLGNRFPFILIDVVQCRLENGVPAGRHLAI